MTTSTDFRTTGPAAGPDIDRHRRLVRGLTAYLLSFATIVTTLVLVAKDQGADLDHLDDASALAQIALFGAAFVPMVAMLAAWATSGVGPDWGFRRTPTRLLLVAWFVPMLAAVITYLPAWASDVAGFESDGMSDHYGGLPLPVAVLVGVLPGLIPWIVLAIGEELGWSSWFVVRLAELRGRTEVALAFGLLWGLGHVPMMLLVPGAVADGVAKPVAVALFLTQTVAMAFPMVHLRLDGRSIWPVLVLHAGLNASIYFVGDLLTDNYADTEHYLGEGALFTALAMVVSVLLTAPLWRKRGR